MKTILVPIDFSEEANNALDVACEIAKISRSEVILLHVIDAPASTSSINVVGDYSSPIQENIYMIELMEHAKQQMNGILSGKKNTGVNLKEKVTLGNIFSSIESEVEEKNIDLIIMGSKGTSGMDELLLGSNTEKVVRRTKCPVLTIKKKQEEFKLKDIVFATTLTEDQGIVVNKLKKIQELFGSVVHLLRVNTPGHFEDTVTTRKQMLEFVQRYQLENYTFNSYNAKVAEDGIISFAEDINANLIALGTHGRTGFAHLIKGSIAEDIVNHATRMVLTINMNN